MLFKKKIDFNIADMHCHILPGTDDGAKDLKISVAMLDIAYSEGIRRIVVTPHFHPVKCMLSAEQVKNRLEGIKEVAIQLYPDLELYAGREIYYTNGVEEEISNLGLTINGTRYVLVEFDFNESRHNIRTYVNNILNEGFIPIVAHIERYYDCLKDEEFAYDLKVQGALIQINASAILGDEGAEAKKYVRNLLKEEVVDIVATDAHSAGHRAPRIQKAVAWIAGRCGVDYAKRVVWDNPEKVLKDDYLD